MKQYFKWMLTVLFFIVLSCSPTLIFAQIDPGCEPCSYPQGCRPDGSPCPIDSYVYILVAIGIGYGIIKVRNAKKAEGETAKNALKGIGSKII
jgi:hypothetical protein